MDLEQQESEKAITIRDLDRQISSLKDRLNEAKQEMEIAKQNHELEKQRQIQITEQRMQAQQLEITNIHAHEAQTEQRRFKEDLQLKATTILDLETKLIQANVDLESTQRKLQLEIDGLVGNNGELRAETMFLKQQKDQLLSEKQDRERYLEQTQTAKENELFALKKEQDTIIAETHTLKETLNIRNSELEELRSMFAKKTSEFESTQNAKIFEITDLKKQMESKTTMLNEAHNQALNELHNENDKNSIFSMRKYVFGSNNVFFDIFFPKYGTYRKD